MAGKFSDNFKTVLVQKINATIDVVKLLPAYQEIDKKCPIMLSLYNNVKNVIFIPKCSLNSLLHFKWPILVVPV